MTMDDAAVIGGGRTFSLTSMAVVQCGSSTATHMYMHREVHTWDTRHERGRASSLFGFVPSVSVAISPLTGRRMIAPSDRDREERPRHSRPAEKFVLVVASGDINIFDTLPNWQGKLLVRPMSGNDWAFFLVLV